MTSDNRYALCIIAKENGLVFRDGMFFRGSAKFVPTPLGFVPNINYNYRIRYDELKGVATRVSSMKEQVVSLRKDILAKGSRRAILRRIETLSPEEAVKWIKNYLR